MVIKNIFGHLKTVLTHKYWVFYYSCKLGIPWRGFVHDLSKFSPIEFWESVKYYQGGKSSPINACKADRGYSLAWQHHKGRNPHHYEYWVDKLDEGGIAINMPAKYKLEMLADYLAAGKVYMGDAFSYKAEHEWLKNKFEKNPKMHTSVRCFLDVAMRMLCIDSDKGFPLIKDLAKLYT